MYKYGIGNNELVKWFEKSKRIQDPYNQTSKIHPSELSPGWMDFFLTCFYQVRNFVIISL
jgi:hypothetical protein